jgi:adenylate cyclase
MCDQVGLLRRRLEYEKELERKTAELEASYAQLESIHQENLRMQEVLRRYVPPSTWEKVEVGGVEGAGGIEQTMTCAVMFVDICGFTRLVESARPAQLVGLLNAYFTAVAAICYQHGGEIVKYIGDGIMGFFRAGGAAVAGVKEILEAQAKISEQVAAIGIGEIKLRVGVSWGPVILTSVGPFYQQDRTILGDTVNTAARLESRALPGSALFDSALLEHREPATFGLATVGVVSLRGKKRPVTVLTLASDRARYSTGATGEIARPDEGLPPA